MGGLGTLKPGSGDSHWAGISKMYWHISVGGLEVEIQASKVWPIFSKDSKDFQPFEGFWASWGGPGSQEAPQAHCPWCVDGFRLWNFSNQTSSPRVIYENYFELEVKMLTCVYDIVSIFLDVGGLDLWMTGSWWSQTTSLMVLLVSRIICKGPEAGSFYSLPWIILLPKVFQ